MGLKHPASKRTGKQPEVKKTANFLIFIRNSLKIKEDIFRKEDR
jgi:hypothetical protein